MLTDAAVVGTMEHIEPRITGKIIQSRAKQNERSMTGRKETVIVYSFWDQQKATWRVGGLCKPPTHQVPLTFPKRPYTNPLPCMTCSMFFSTWFSPSGAGNCDALEHPYLEGQGDLVSSLITPITHIVTLVIPLINLVTKSPDPPSTP